MRTEGLGFTRGNTNAGHTEMGHTATGRGLELAARGVVGVGRFLGKHPGDDLGAVRET